MFGTKINPKILLVSLVWSIVSFIAGFGKSLAALGGYSPKQPGFFEQTISALFFLPVTILEAIIFTSGKLFSLSPVLNKFLTNHTNFTYIFVAIFLLTLCVSILYLMIWLAVLILKKIFSIIFKSNQP